MKHGKKFYTIFILGAILLLNTVVPIKIAYAKEVKPPKISAESALILDGDTGQIVYSKNSDKPYFPASTTKVMTALIVLENANLHDKVKIGKNPPYADGSSIGLKEGEIFSVEDLLTGLMLESGNDCALALAEHVAGSETKFAELMNKKASELGCTNTNFKNPSGLPNENHLTTTHDLSLIMRDAIKYDDFIRISTIPFKKLPKSNLDGFERIVNNHNSLIDKNSKLYYEHTIAGKSGYTIAARHTFTVAARKNGRTLIGSFIKAEDKNQNYKDMAALLEYGFSNTDNIKLYSTGDIIEEIPLTKTTSIPLSVEKDFIYTKNKTAENIETKLNFDLPADIKTKSLKKGEIITSAKILENNIPIGEVNIISTTDRNYNIFIGIKEFSQNNPSTAFGILLSTIIILTIIIKIILTKKNKRDRKKLWENLKRKQKFNNLR
ncbi:MAG: D-alanyl-D-alanine carboxypeptidase family protein [Clostridium sp.]|uniref:D-alanyl-D-alanine carboxypeptidase family protein n=1 Tax=Clostridium sp. TaxID=1506 RepID=UPI003EE50C06